jgi:hypothetical protein
MRLSRRRQRERSQDQFNVLKQHTHNPLLLLLLVQFRLLA